jgi:hypothetical protein
MEPNQAPTQPTIDPVQMPAQPVHPTITRIQPTPESSPESKQAFPRWILIIVAMMIISLIVTGFFAFGDNLFKRNGPAVVQHVPGFVTTPTPTPDPTVSWASYQGTDFAFKYPQNWNPIDNTSVKKGSVKDLNNEIIFTNTSLNPVKSLTLDVYSTSAAQIIARDFQTAQISNTNLGSIVVTKATISSAINSTSIILIPFAKKSVQLSVNTADKEILDQVFSTFGFTR